MLKNYRKISIVAYLNVIVILLLQVAHESSINLSHTLMFRILFVYALINGWYVQRLLSKQKDIEKNLENERLFSNKILESMSSSVIISNFSGQITYINNASKGLFGIDKFIDNHISVLFNGNEKVLSLFEAAKCGEVSSRVMVENHSVDNNKYFLIEVFPFSLETENKQIMIHVDDITENVELNNHVERQYLNMFRSFVKFIDAKDTYTGLHSASVSNYVTQILARLDLDEAEKRDILTAANLHDIGKIGVPEYILNKPLKLTKEEFDKMKLHPVIGESLIGEISGYERIAKIIRHHHEKYDGSGYPDGIKGSNIPLGSRIIAVADAFDAITTDRVYQKKRSFEEAREILIQQQSLQFDKRIVEVFLESMSS